jgi:hypothetical protein
VRGILCSRHNAMIGWAQDDPKILEKAARYLRAHQESLWGLRNDCIYALSLNCYVDGSDS